MGDYRTLQTMKVNDLSRNQKRTRDPLGGLRCILVFPELPPHSACLNRVIGPLKWLTIKMCHDLCLQSNGIKKNGVL